MIYLFPEYKVLRGLPDNHSASTGRMEDLQTSGEFHHSRFEVRNDSNY